MARGARFHALVGASVLQTPGGIQSELEKIDHEIESFGTEIEGSVHAAGAPVANKSDSAAWSLIKHKAETQTTPPAISNLPIVRFYNDAWIPFVIGWRAWYHDHNGWFHNLWWNEAPTGESYQEKLAGMMAAAKKLGMTVSTPAPDVEGRSIADPRRASPVDLAGDALDQIAKVGKYALWGGLVLGGTFAAVKIVEVARGK